jgi:hypothetical protein
MLGMKIKRTLAGALVLAAAVIGANAAAAEPLPVPREKPILTISGNITQSNKDNTAQFDRPMLEALGLTTIETKTPWYEGPAKF